MAHALKICFDRWHVEGDHCDGIGLLFLGVLKA